ncbi:MAG: MiaB/RimO family radical SAM methylthiotransferase [Pirellulales bacterium]|nr:MiaB/RimO family radical SAM methylthiotransferase [Pirellulales bacterium]
MIFRTVTLGCKVNQYETEYVREGLLGIGWKEALDGEPADLCLINTCTVTAEGDAKSRRAIRRLSRENPDARLIVMGCYATRVPEEIAQLPNVTDILPDKRELPRLLNRLGVADPPTGVSGMGRRHRAYVKVQDGCILRCSYCIIPYVRPNLTSRPVDHILDEVRRLVANGYREVVLTGIHLGHYGLAGPGTRHTVSDRRPQDPGIQDARGRNPDSPRRLAWLVRTIAELPGDFRIRLSSIEATEVTRELLAVMTDHGGKICPHLHLSMQSGSETVLHRMRRRWGAKRFIDRCRLVQETLDRPALTTDVMVGFPGETDSEFAETVTACREVGFSKIHIFPFSPRTGTPAATMRGQIPPHVKKERVQQLTAVGSELRESYFRSLFGSRLRVLMEGVTGIENRPNGEPSDQPAVGEVHASDVTELAYKGTACRYVPVVTVPNHKFTPVIGQFVDVTAQELVRGQLVLNGEIV